MEFKSEEIDEYTFPEEYYSWEQIELLIKRVANEIVRSNKRYYAILGITNGGIIPARLIARELDIDHILFIPIRCKKLHREEMPSLSESRKYLVVDDIYDTGNTFSVVSNEIGKFDCDFAFLIRRFADNGSGREEYIGEILDHKKWIVFPWERKNG
ncbi:MAG: phosphoribosyltransferase family protein [Nitrososphaeraceae archaeon]